jgi:hypothetical protein
MPVRSGSRVPDASWIEDHSEEILDRLAALGQPVEASTPTSRARVMAMVDLRRLTTPIVRLKWAGH